MVEPVPVHLMPALTPAQVGSLCGGLSEDSVRRLISKGVLRTVPHSQYTLIARAEVDRWLTSNLDRERQEGAA